MQKILKTTLMGIGMLCMTSVFAGGPDKAPVDYSGFYLGGNLGAAYAAGGGLGATQWGFGVTGLVGYQFNPIFGLEAGGFYAPNLYRYTFAGGAASGYLNFSDLYLAVKVTIPFTRQFNVFAKVGPALFWDSGCSNPGGTVTCSSNSTSIGPYMSAGAGLRFTKNLELTAELGGIPPFNQQGLSWFGNMLAGIIYHF